MLIGPGTGTLLASMAAGAALGAAFAAAMATIGTGPEPLLQAIAASCAGALFLPGARGARLGAALGVASFLGALVLPGLVGPGPSLELVARVAPWILGAGAGLASRLGAPALQRVDGRHAPALALAFVLGCRLPPVAALLVTVALGAAAAQAQPSLANLGARRPEFRPTGLLVASGVAVLAAAAWFLVRPAADPTPSSLCAVGVGVILGTSLPRARGFALFLVVAATAMGARTLLAGPPGGASLVFFVLGAAAGHAGRSSRPGTLGALVPALAAVTMIPVVRALPASWQALGARAVVGLPGDTFLRDRVTALRAGAPTATTWSPSGASQVWGKEGISLVELDGAVAGSSGRARAAERLAGTLAGCATQRREHVRLIGDDFGRATLSLREQGFAGIDVAVADPALAERIAGADEGVRRAWLGADVRLLRVPGMVLERSRGRVDALVQLLRVGWRDGRTSWPDPGSLVDSAAHVAEGGAHVLLVPGLGVAPDDLEGVVHNFADQWANVAIFVPPQGAESLVLVGTGKPLAWTQLGHCYEAATWLRKEGVASPTELASLAVADHHFARALESRAVPGWGFPAGQAALPVVDLLRTATEADHVFGGDVPASVAERQSTRRAALGVLLASSQGDVKGALAQARSLADQPGAGAAIDPMIAPLLERARTSAQAARSEGEDSPKWAEADSAIEAALLMNPASAAARCLRGDIALARRRADEALRHYQDCADHDAQSASAWEGLGRTKQLLGDDVGAEAALRSAARLAPESWTPALNLGVFLNHRGNLAEAEEWLRRAEDAASASREPGRSRPHLALAMLYLQSQRAQLALAEAGRAEVDETSADSAFWTGAAQYELKAWPEAEAAYRLAIQRRPTMVEAQNGLGLCLARRGDYAGAAAAFRAVLALDSGNQMAREKLELLRPALGHEDDAVRGSAPPLP